MDAVDDYGGTEYPKKFNQKCVHREYSVAHTEEQDQTIEQLEAQEQVNQLLTKGYWENENLYE
jgi:hypothetical protein